MAGDTQSWVAQYGDALANLDSYTKSIGQGGAPGQPGAPAPAPAQQGAFAAASQAGAPGALQPPAAAPAPGALAPAPNGRPALPSAGLAPPAELNSQDPHNFHNVWQATPDDQKDHIVNQMEKNGIDIQARFKQLQSDGVINAPTADYAKQDMAGFVMEAGLRMAQAGAKGDYNSNPFASAATGILGAVEGRRDRQLQTAQMAFNQQNTMYQRELDAAKLKQEERIAELQRGTQVQIAKTNEEGRQATAQTSANARITAASTLAGARVGAARIEANKPTQNNTITDADGKVFWKGGTNDGKPVMVDDGQGGQRQITTAVKGSPPKNQFGEKDVESAVSKHESDLNKNGFTSKIDDGKNGQVSWAKATEAQKQAHLDQYASGVRSRAAAAAPAAGKTAAATGDNPYAKFVKGGTTQTKAAPAAAAKEADDEDDSAALDNDDADDQPAVEAK